MRKSAPRRAGLIGALVVFWGFASCYGYAEDVPAKEEDIPQAVEASPNQMAIIDNPAIVQRPPKNLYGSAGLARTWVDKNHDGMPDTVCLWKGGVKILCWEDTDFDGRMNKRSNYDEKARVVRKISDLNRDGRPDQYQLFPDGTRQFVWKEYDRNGDGRIDRRVYSQWEPDRKMTVVLGSRVTQMPIPGYKTLIKEEDNNYDGIIDVYYDRGGPQSKVGQSIDPKPKFR